jgi:hypothetical protein
MSNAIALSPASLVTRHIMVLPHFMDAPDKLRNSTLPTLYDAMAENCIPMLIIAQSAQDGPGYGAQNSNASSFFPVDSFVRA